MAGKKQPEQPKPKPKAKAKPKPKNKLLLCHRCQAKNYYVPEKSPDGPQQVVKCTKCGQEIRTP